jgi:hypothetical protein
MFLRFRSAHRLRGSKSGGFPRVPTPERARIDPVRIDLKHLIEEFSRGRRSPGYTVEIADVSTGILDDPRTIVVFSPLVSGDHRARLQRLDCIFRA